MKTIIITANALSTLFLSPNKSQKRVHVVKYNVERIIQSISVEVVEILVNSPKTAKQFKMKSVRKIFLRVSIRFLVK